MTAGSVRELRPGDICTQGGLYEVVHRDHREPHRAVVSSGDVFPRCRHCGEAVRFHLMLESTADGIRPRARAAHPRHRP